MTTSPAAAASPVPPAAAQAAAGADQTAEDEEVPAPPPPPPVKKKRPMERLIQAVRDASRTEALRSSVVADLDSMRSIMDAVPAVPLPPYSSAANNNKMRRVFDVTSSSCSGSPPVGTCSLYDDGEEHGANKRQKTQSAAKEVLLGEIEAINTQLIDTTASIIYCRDNNNNQLAADGILIKLSYTGVSLAPATRLKSHDPIASAILVMPVLLLVTADYPATSPTIIVSDEGDEQLRKTFSSSSISTEVDSAFRRALRLLPEPRSLKQTATAWDACVRRAVTDFAQQHGGGGTLGSRLGRWESCNNDGE